ncbi:chemotaxis protein CheB [Tundrisphaera sp. TA3]|uniref:chemotaxis protein CheB n=1 Tax=Tundrisphaera sp. TA3 TaxID=3435775 RepID=UPI003EB9BC85
MAGHDIIVFGGSAGALEAMNVIVDGFPPGLPAAVFVAFHSSPHSPGLLPEIFNHRGKLPAAHARDGEPVAPSRIYIAPPDHHLLLEHGRVRVTRGPKENRFRPAVDPLFRSAALAYGPRVVGVILSGWLDDGAAGLWAIKARGGVAIVQEPEEAFARSMPEAALRQSRVDHRLRAEDIAPTLAELVAGLGPDERDFPVPEGLEIETRIAMEDKALQAGVRDIGEPSLFACPECHGVLMRMKTGGGPRYRCHTGHSYTADSLLSEMTEVVEESLWNAVRSVQESSILMEHMAAHAREAGQADLAALYDRKASEARGRAEMVRRAVMGHENLSEEKLAGG